MDLWQVGAVWLHTVAFVIAWGYYGIVGRFVSPALGPAVGPEREAATLLEIERRALPFVLLTVVLFTLTGSYLLVTDDRYQGLGDFGTTWAQLMLAKHVLVVLLVVLGVFVDRLVRAASGAASADDRATALHRLRLATEAATAVGALIALLTAASQAV
ncbi:MAG TPA: CopD family protein [Candidatus Limnocylindrales bacterium]|jgi:uncharacterized membrane protein